MNPKFVRSILTSLALGSLAVFSARGADPKPNPEADIAKLQAFSSAFENVAEKIKPSVVTVFSAKTIHAPRMQRFGGLPFDFNFDDDSAPQPQQRRSQRGRDYKQTGMGSGVVIDKDGHILTNNHVIDDTDEIKIKLADGSIYDAEVLGSDPRTDVAILKFKGKIPTSLVPATFGDSDALRVGEWVMAVGAPFGYEQTVTVGIISAKGRMDVDNDSTKYQDFLQTDAAINPGNSGGPLVNLRGEVIGINTAIATSVGQFAGVGFAIPVNMVKHVMRDLVKSGKVARGFLGVGIQDVDSRLAEQLKTDNTKGAAVNQVAKDSPASRAGLKVGDVITKFNGKEIDNTLQLHNLVAETDPDSKVDVVVLREGKERTVPVTVGLYPEEGGNLPHRGGPREDRKSRSSSFGITVEPLTPALAQQMGYDKDAGVLVSAVDDDSAADDAGLRPGDLILEVNHAPVTNLKDFQAAISKVANKALLLIKNKEGTHFVVMSTK